MPAARGFRAAGFAWHAAGPDGRRLTGAVGRMTSFFARGGLRRATALLLLAYPLLAIAGAVTHRAAFALAALLLLLTLWLLPRLLDGGRLAWSGWATGVAVVLAVSAAGLTEALLEAVPVLIMLGLSCWFGATLRVGREPLVARFIRVLEGDDRLALPGVRAYARQLTAFWAGLLALQALVLAVLLVLALPGGIDLPRWVRIYQHVGGYLAIALAFAAEYVYRRWRLRHVEHPGLHAQALQLMQRWPQLLHGRELAP